MGSAVASHLPAFTSLCVLTTFLAAKVERGQTPLLMALYHASTASALVLLGNDTDINATEQVCLITFSTPLAPVQTNNM